MDTKTVFSARRGIFYPAATGVCGAALVFSLWAWLAQNWILGGFVACALGVIFLVSAGQMFCTRYTLGEESLEVRSGLSVIRVLFDEMDQVGENKISTVDGYVPMALDKNPLYIYFSQRGKYYRLEISPLDREEFRKELVRRAPHLA